MKTTAQILNEEERWNPYLQKYTTISLAESIMGLVDAIDPIIPTPETIAIGKKNLEKKVYEYMLNEWKKDIKKLKRIAKKNNLSESIIWELPELQPIFKKYPELLLLK